MHRTLRRLVLVLVVVLTLPAVASAKVWRPHAETPAARVALVPLEPMDGGAPLVFPARGAPHIIVGVAPGADLDAVAGTLRPFASSLRILRAIGAVSLVASNGAAVAGLAAHDPRIAFATPERTLQAEADRYDALDPATGFLYDWQYDAVRAGPALAAVGGGSATVVAIVDSGIDVLQPDLAGRILPGYDATETDGSVTDVIGHGTFVAGLVSMVDGNGIGGKGIGGATMVLPVRASLDTGFRESATIAGVIWAADNGAGVINLSLGGPSDDPALDRAIRYAADKNVLVVASAGNDGDSPSNPPAYPAALVGGTKGGWSIGLSVGATMPNNLPASFSSHNDHVSIAAPGAGPRGCASGVFSTLPTNVLTTEWDDPDPCNTVFYATASQDAADGRWGYGEGTSFSAPIVSAVAALVRQANPLLAAGQVADVLRRSATQTLGTGWNARTGAGLVNAEAAVALARVYDTAAPAIAFTTTPRVGGIEVDLVGVDAVTAGTRAAGVGTAAVDASVDGGVTWSRVIQAGGTALHRVVPIAVPTLLRGEVCDANHNCMARVAGPLNALVPAAAAKHPKIKLRILSRRHRKLQVRLSLGAGGTGKVTVQIEAWSGTRWRAFDRVRIGYGTTVTRTEHVTKTGRYRLRARIAATQTNLQATSRSITLRVG